MKPVIRSVYCTCLQVVLQNGSVSEDECVEDSLAGSVERPMQTDITADLFSTTVLIVNVVMDPGNQQVQTCLNSAVVKSRETVDLVDCVSETRHLLFS